MSEKVVYEFYDNCKFEIRDEDGELSYWMFDSATESWLYLDTTETEMLAALARLAAENEKLRAVKDAAFAVWYLHIRKLESPSEAAKDLRKALEALEADDE